MLSRVLESVRRVVPPLVFDFALAAAFLALTVADLLFPHGDDGYVGGSTAVNVPLVLVVPLCLAARRQAPTTAYCVQLGSVLLPGLVIAHTVYFWAGFLPIVIMVYTVGRYSGSVLARYAWATGVVFALVLGLHLPAARGPAAVFFDGILCAAAWIAGRTMRRFDTQGAALRKTLAALAEEQSAREEAAVQAERGRIAVEMHDVVAHAVSLMVVQVGATRLELERDGEKQPRLLAAEQAGREALVELRRTLGVLRAGAAPGDASRQPLPGLDAAPALVAQLREAGLPVAFDLGDIGPLPASTQLAAYRILQEALTNALEYGERETVTAAVRRVDDQLRIDVTNPVRGPGRGDFPGLFGMRQRVAMFRGSLRAGRAADRFEVHAVLPLAEVDLVQEVTS